MKGKIYLSVAIVMVAAMLLAFGCAPAPVVKEPIVIGYVGNVASAGTKPCMDIMKLAAEEINAAGGILGRTIECKIGDGKGEATLSVEAAIRMVTVHKALAFWVEGRSEINLAIKAKSAEFFHDYPHIVICNGAVAPEITEGIVTEYDKYKFMFRDVDWACIPWYYTHNFYILKNIIGAKKIAMLYEDLLWTKGFREGTILEGLPSMADYAEQHWGLEVVYNKPVKYRAGMYLPIFEAIKASGADAIYYMVSWFSDDEVFAKQWAESAAKDLPIVSGAGTISHHTFYDMTGGKALGAIGWAWDEEIPMMKTTIPFIKKVRARGITPDMNSYLIYSDVYLLKKAIEKVGNTDDIDAIIKALEEVEVEGPLGTHTFRSPREEPWFHGYTMSDPDNRLEMAAGVNFPWGQWQLNGERVIIYNGIEGVPWAHPEKYKSPAELRKLQTGSPDKEGR